MFKSITEIFDESRRELKKMDIIAKEIDALDAEMMGLTDSALQMKTEELKIRVLAGATLDEILVEAFAVVREAASRVLGKKPFFVQLLGALSLHRGDIAEMKTGEGKTLTSLMPAYLNAISGKGVHIITVNEYLAKRDADEMGQVHRFLGLTVGLNINSMSAIEKQKGYACDIVYSTNSEVGFDYLRDNMVLYAKDKVQRPLNYAIVDEVDSILIDEARTPLIISGGKKNAAPLYHAADKFVKSLKKVDYEIDYEAKSIQLTPVGVTKAEKTFRTMNLFAVEHTELVHRILQGLRANYIMLRDVEYVVSGGEVKIVDQFTGRILEGRRYNDGLHQAIEAKESVEMKEETATLATITYQNYFRLYKKLSGMTGTAKTEEEEFLNTYNMRVICIPTNKDIIRQDESDVIYATLQSKYIALVAEITERHKKGQPILVGTVAVESSEIISKMLKKEGVPHEVLNAKNHEREADIIADAGKKGSVTIATNMAGRGTDIKLGADVPKLGGLAVLGSERHESRRIDNQLRGRSGRQGDPGYSRFFISFGDELLLRFGNQQMITRALEKTMQGDALESKIFAKRIESAQSQIEGVNHDVRKQILQYDDVLRRQREIMYAQRDTILNAENIDKLIEKMIIATARNIVVSELNNGLKKVTVKEKAAAIITEIEKDFSMKTDVNIADLELLQQKEFTVKIEEMLIAAYIKKHGEVPTEMFEEFQKVISLRVLDDHWMRHIDAMSHLRESIHLRGYAQRNPVYAYQEEAFEMFEAINRALAFDITQYVLRSQIVDNLKRKEAVKGQSANRGGINPEQKKKELAEKVEAGPVVTKSPKTAIPKPAVKKVATKVTPKSVATKTTAKATPKPAVKNVATKTTATPKPKPAVKKVATTPAKPTVKKVAAKTTAKATIPKPAVKKVATKATPKATK
ncbi:preprotein translocase subunit [Erysipelotrichaceae bacterium]|nr:preprotein translocase subunit [Erysipelotrichaceae bacterium]